MAYGFVERSQPSDRRSGPIAVKYDPVISSVSPKSTFPPMTWRIAGSGRWRSTDCHALVARAPARDPSDRLRGADLESGRREAPSDRVPRHHLSLAGRRVLTASAWQVC